MSNFNTNERSATTELDFFWRDQSRKVLSISWPAYHIRAELIENVDFGKHSLRLWYNDEEVTSKVKAYNLVEDLMTIDAPEELSMWISENDPDNPAYEEIDGCELRILRRMLATMIVKSKNYDELDLPATGDYLDEDEGSVEYLNFDDQAAVVCHDSDSQTVLIYFLGLNARFGVRLFTPALDDSSAVSRREVVLENGAHKLLQMNDPAFEALLDEFEDQYDEYTDFLRTKEFEGWLAEMHGFIETADTEDDAADTAEAHAEAPELHPIDEENAYRKLGTMLYAQRNPGFVEGVIRSLPEACRKQILDAFMNAIEAAQDTIKPGDIVMYEHGGFHIAVSGDNEMIHTLTKKNGFLVADSLPVQKVYPTGGFLDGWNDAEYALDMYNGC